MIKEMKSFGARLWLTGNLLCVFTSFAGNAAAGAEQENFKSVLRRIQDTYWEGKFMVTSLNGLWRCEGPLNVAFFPLTKEKFSNGVKTISYRHHADFSQTDPVCQLIAGTKSPVDVGDCEDIFPAKYSRREGQWVPFRTIIPRDGGKSAVVSSPSCKDHQVVRQELNLARLELSDNDRVLQVTIKLDLPVLGEVSEFTYLLERRR